MKRLQAIGTQATLILTLGSLLSCEQSMEQRVIGTWVSTAHKSYVHGLKGRTDKFVIDTVSITFLEHSKAVLGIDTVDLIFREGGYVYTAESYANLKSGDEYFDFHILDVTDSTLTVEFFWGRDTVFLRRIRLSERIDSYDPLF